ncbi:Probable polyol transporter 6 [Linum grandiflorum]
MKPTLYSVALALVALLSFFHLGYDAAVTLSVVAIGRDLNMTESQLGEMLDMADRACVSAALVAGIALNYAGRRSIILLGFCSHAAGALLMSAGVIDAGRVLMGLSFGLGLTAGPVYVAEIAPAKHRGLLISLSQFLFVLGELAGYSAHYMAEAHLNSHISWRVVIVIGVLPSLLLAAILPFFFFFDESPCWLVLRGKLAEAAAVMEKCGVAAAESLYRRDQMKFIAGIPATVTDDNIPVQPISATMKPFWMDITALPHPISITLVILAALHALPPLSGADIAIRLESTYFPDPPKVDFLGEFVCLGVRLAASLCPILLVDEIERRETLCLSLGLTVVAAWMLGGTMLASDAGAIDEDMASMLGVIAAIFLQSGHAIGLGIVPWICGAEAFQFLIRAPVFGIVVALNRAVASVVAVKFGWLYARIGGGVFLICGGAMVLPLMSFSWFGIAPACWTSPATTINKITAAVTDQIELLKLFSPAIIWFHFLSISWKLTV